MMIRRLAVLPFLLLGVASTIHGAAAPGGFTNFITTSGDKLMDGNKEFRFISLDISNMAFNEDPQTNGVDWHLPVTWEQEDAIKTIVQMGGQATRIYTITVKGGTNVRNNLYMTDGNGNFNDSMFLPLDRALQLFNKYGVRVIIPFVDEWDWVGGKNQYGGSGDLFDPNSGKFANFKKTINYVLNRTNRYTGVQYKNDKAILAWETGNEISPSYAWTQAVAQYVKSIDQNHLVMDGNNNFSDGLNIPEINIVTDHYYQGGGGDYVSRANNDRNATKGKKPFIIGEFGCVPKGQWSIMTGTIQAALNNGTPGAMVWSLRYHNKNGGFYFHNDQDLSNSYHYPGFSVDDWFGETPVMSALRSAGFQVQGLSVPTMPVPDPPVLLPFEDPTKISWRGSVGGANYNVERAPAVSGPWTAVGTGVSDAIVIEDAGKLFSDAVTGNGPYFYRVKAVNTSGTSNPSNLIVYDKVTPNVALKKVVTASTQNPANPVSNLVDGNVSTYWSTPAGASDTQWVVLNLGTSYQVQRIQLRWNAAYASQYTVQISPDSLTWTAIDTENYGHGGLDEVVPTSTTYAKYIRLNFLAPANAGGYALNEFEVYGAPSTAIFSRGEHSNGIRLDYGQLSPRLIVQEDQAYALDLYSLTGARIRHLEGTGNGSHNLGDLARGVYRAVLTTAQGRTTGTIELIH